MKTFLSSHPTLSVSRAMVLLLLNLWLIAPTGNAAPDTTARASSRSSLLRSSSQKRRNDSKKKSESDRIVYHRQLPTIERDLQVSNLCVASTVNTAQTNSVVTQSASVQFRSNSSGGKKQKSDDDDKDKSPDKDKDKGQNNNNNNGNQPAIELLTNVQLQPLVPELRAQGFLLFADALERTGVASLFTTGSSAQYTMFAPDDFAMMKYTNHQTLSDFLQQGGTVASEKLRDVLLYHIVQCRIPYAAQLKTSPASSFPATVTSMLKSKPFEILRGSDNPYSAGFTLKGTGNSPADGLPIMFQTDIQASNGIIHGINKVMEPSDPTLPALLESNGLTTLSELLTITGLDQQLMAPNLGLTLLAPTNDAFANTFTAQELQELKTNRLEELKNVLSYHVLVDGALTFSQLSSNANPVMNAPTLLGAGQTVEIRSTGAASVTALGQGNVLPTNLALTDARATNGVILQTMNGVLLPGRSILDAAKAAGTFTYFLEAVQAAGLTDLLSDSAASLTVLAPTDAAFASLVEQGTLAWWLENPTMLHSILSYHVILDNQLESTSMTKTPISVDTALDGSSFPTNLKLWKSVLGEIMVQGTGNELNPASVKDMADASNGVLFAIDQVLMPPALSASCIGMTGYFQFFYAALEATNQWELLNSITDVNGAEMNFTIFVPTDEAFVAAGYTLESLLAMDEVELTELLEAHVLDPASFVNAVPSFQLIQFAGYTRRFGSLIELPSLLQDHGGLSVNVRVGADASDASIVHLSAPGNNGTLPKLIMNKSDMRTQNGIIHAVDGVLIPY